MQELLPVLDNLDRALEAEGDIREGVQATREQLAEVLANEGLLPVASDGQPFDPNVHEAVMGQPSDEHEEGTITPDLPEGLPAQRQADPAREGCGCETGLGYGDAGSLQGSRGIQGGLAG